jgi:hypothetical protein
VGLIFGFGMAAFAYPVDQCPRFLGLVAGMRAFYLIPITDRSNLGEALRPYSPAADAKISSPSFGNFSVIPSSAYR